jgi:F0F1-type ATP synthase membrane subunit c/vacuolar-type H+-ATPase subunit K
MKRITFFIFLILALVFSLSSLFPIKALNAQVSSSGFAVSIPLKEDVEAGDIICLYDDGFRKCNSEYDTSMYGVIVDNVSVSVEDTELENSNLALTSGVAEVKVSGVGGDINDGDLITTTTNAGIGQKANESGFVLGSAIEAVTFGNPDQIQTIQVALNIHPSSTLGGARTNLLRYIREGLTVPVFSPVESFRYLLAVLMVIVAFTLGMIYFGRSSRAGIEAIGRNPLARREIRLTVIFNIVLTIVIVLVGLAIAYLILIL